MLPILAAGARAASAVWLHSPAQRTGRLSGHALRCAPKGQVLVAAVASRRSRPIGMPGKDTKLYNSAIAIPQLFRGAQMSQSMDSQPEQWPRVSVCKRDKLVVLRLVQFTVREIRYASSSAGDRATAKAAVISNWRSWLVGGAADRARRRWVSRDCKPLRWAVSVANRSGALI
ncbi:hypothetical protein BKA63DRAFT_494903 [Paraphoma chrysanthemicola]|nr:hypothetical protein BKA63DRAFT_494903 [Paraphoma chrysanthemicola]